MWSCLILMGIAVLLFMEGICNEKTKECKGSEAVGEVVSILNSDDSSSIVRYSIVAQIEGQSIMCKSENYSTKKSSLQVGEQVNIRYYPVYKTYPETGSDVECLVISDKVKPIRSDRSKQVIVIAVLLFIAAFIVLLKEVRTYGL